ncbi:MAG: hypothetical protein IAG10_18335 [Planctomycetaceae bacterium]|nr:hypothetical protein [Planctomycetaceae bacterium]
MRILLALILLPTMASAADISFKAQLAPILARRCLGCHDNRKTEGRFALHTFEQMLKPGDSGERPIVPGKPSDSYLFQKLIETDDSARMPQEDDPLSATDIALFKAWIEQGAKFDGPAVTDRIVTLLPPRQHPRPPETYRVPVPVFALRFSPDGQSLFTSGMYEVLVWDATTGKLQRRIPGMPQRIHSLRFSPNRQTLAVAGGAPGEYGEIRLVTLADGSARVLPAWEDVVLDVAFSADGRQLVAGGADNSVRAYDIESGRTVWRTQQHVDWVTALDVTDYRFAEEYVPNADASAVFDFNDQEKASNSHLRQHWQFPDGSYIVRRANWELEATRDGVVSLTRVTTTGIGTTYKVKREVIPADTWKDHTAVIDLLKTLHSAWDRQATETPLVVSASRDRTVKIFSLRTGTLFTTYKGHRREYGPLAGMHRVYGVQTEPRTRRVWSGGEGRHFHGWNPITVRDEDGTAADMESRFAKEYSIDALRHDFSDAVFAMVRSGERLYAASASGHVKQFTIAGPTAKFDINAPAPGEAFTGQQDQLFGLDVHAGTSRIAAAGFTGEVVIWASNSDKPLTRFLASPTLSP